MLKTDNLQLLKWNISHLKALHISKDDLAALLQLSIPVGWPQFPEAFSLPADENQASSEASDWGGYFFIDLSNKALVGSGGFHGQPDVAGNIEIGYEIAPEYWNRGFGTKAARQLMDFAFAHVEVQAVSATTLAEPNASNNVLQKIGMKFMNEIDDPEDGKLWRYQITRSEYAAR